MCVKIEGETSTEKGSKEQTQDGQPQMHCQTVVEALMKPVEKIGSPTTSSRTVPSRTWLRRFILPAVDEAV